MQVLLPPSETKRFGGDRAHEISCLAHDTALRDVRFRVRDALLALCSDAEAAATALKLRTNAAAEIGRNLSLGAQSNGQAMPAIERYTGVLYGALDLPSLDDAARAWLDTHVSVQSALFGLIAASDTIPGYRLSASTRLPQLGAPLKRVWAAAHEALEWSNYGWVLDLRSKEYAALAPLPAGAGVWLRIVTRAPDGKEVALNHFNKAAKGRLLRLLLQRFGSASTDHAEIDSTESFLRWAEQQQLTVRYGPSEHELTLIADAP